MQALIVGIAALALTACASAPPRHYNALGMAFVLVPAGHFTMGSEELAASLARDYPQLERERFALLADEAPAHEVRITRAFWLGQHEVTVAQFRRFVEASGYVPESVADGTGGYGYDPAHDPSRAPRGESFAGRDPRWSWQDPGFAQGDDHPVVNVSWHDAVAMAEWLSRTEGRRYRLPTEAEWEYACRAGETAPRTGADLDAVAWYKANSPVDPFTDGTYHKVGTKQPNAWGLHDMLGNVMEWTLDQYAPYTDAPADNPWVRATKPYPHAVRGGSWNDEADKVTCSARVASDADWKMLDPQLPRSVWYMTNAQWLGFRLVRPAALPSADEMYRAWNNGVEIDPY